MGTEGSTGAEPSGGVPAHGMIAKLIRAGMSANAGARMNNTRSARVGMKSSLTINLIASAMGCSRPSGPTRLGPHRSCIHAESLRSSSTRYSAPTAMRWMITRITPTETIN